MKPLKQRFKHDPDNGVWGDCHRAAIASIFELTLDEVPHFGEGGPDGYEFERRVKDFLLSKGMLFISIPYELTLEKVLLQTELFAAGVEFLLGGTSKTGCNHTVVGRGGEGIIHDPSLTDAGIIGPCDDGFYWISYFVLKNPQMIARMAT